MTKNALLLIPLALILSGCGEKPEEAATDPEKAEGAATAAASDQTECETQVIPPVCIPIHANPKIMLNTNTMMTVPPNACVAVGMTVEFTITPDPGTLNTVEIWPKVAADSWLAGTNSGSSDKILITVPTSVPSKTDHDYGWTYRTTGKCVDPRMRVDDQGAIETKSPTGAGVNGEEALDEDMNKAELPD
jgi:hypothetical protein